MVRNIASFPSHSFMLLVFVASKAKILASSSAIVGSVGFGSIPFMTLHNFFVLNWVFIYEPYIEKGFIKFSYMADLYVLCHFICYNLILNVLKDQSWIVIYWDHGKLIFQSLYFNPIHFLFLFLVQINNICKLMHYTFVNLIALIPYENHTRNKR